MAANALSGLATGRRQRTRGCARKRERDTVADLSVRQVNVRRPSVVQLEEVKLLGVLARRHGIVARMVRDFVDDDGWQIKGVAELIAGKRIAAEVFDQARWHHADDRFREQDRYHGKIVDDASGRWRRRDDDGCVEVIGRHPCKRSAVCPLKAHAFLVMLNGAGS